MAIVTLVRMRQSQCGSSIIDVPVAGACVHCQPQASAARVRSAIQQTSNEVERASLLWRSTLAQLLRQQHFPLILILVSSSRPCLRHGAPRPSCSKDVPLLRSCHATPSYAVCSLGPRLFPRSLSSARGVAAETWRKGAGGNTLRVGPCEFATRSPDAE
jgi:hypothetical protein